MAFGKNKHVVIKTAVLSASFYEMCVIGIYALELSPFTD